MSISKTLLIYLIFFISCSEDKPVSIYEGCCDNPPNVHIVGDGKVFAVNFLSTNYDGLNDVFMFLKEGNIDTIDQIKFYNNEGKMLRLLYRFPYYEIIDSSEPQKIIYGRIKYQAVARTKSGVSKFIEGYFCSYPCRRDENPKDYIKDPNSCAGYIRFIDTGWNMKLDNEETCI